MGCSSWTREELEEAVKHNTGIPGILKYMGFPPMGSYYNWIRRKILSLKIDTSHFVKTYRQHLAVPDSEFFIKGKKANGYVIKTRLLKQGVEYKCTNCCGVEWKNLKGDIVKIPLQVDHINGDSTDNRVSNLRLLCPTCHALTDTFCGKNVKRRCTVYTCNMCSITIEKGKSKCAACRKIKPNKYDNFPWPEKSILKGLLLKQPICKSVEELGCDVRSLRAHCKTIGIPNIHTWKVEENRKAKQTAFKKPLRIQKSSRPPKEILQELIWKHPTTYIAKQYSCSDKAVEKWCKKYNISKPPRGYWAKQYSISGREKDMGELV